MANTAVAVARNADIVRARNDREARAAGAGCAASLNDIAETPHGLYKLRAERFVNLFAQMADA